MMKKSLLIFLKGIVLGLSIVLPGISGGTLAFLLGIYNKLLDEISKINLHQIKEFFKFLNFKNHSFKNWKSFLNYHDWKFLIPLFLGIILAIFLFAKLSLPLIQKFYPEFLALIFGLVLISLYSPFKKLKKTKTHLLILGLSFLINASIFYFLKDFAFSTSNMSAFIFFPVGFLIAFALIVPGISGSYLLVILGMYEQTLAMLKDLEISTLSIFLMGVIIGLISMASLIRRLLSQYYDLCVSIILGLIGGSLIGLWPFFDPQMAGVSASKQILIISLILFPILVFSVFYRLFKSQFLK